MPSPMQFLRYLGRPDVLENLMVIAAVVVVDYFLTVSSDRAAFVREVSDTIEAL